MGEGGFALGREDRLNDTKKILRLLLERLEKQLGEDIDKDGRVG